MTKVINLIGASGAGKTTIARELEKMGYNIIHSYTTRKPREENEWGHIFIEEYTISKRNNNEFRFNFRRVNSLGFLNIASSKDMIAYEQLYDHHYFATDEQIIRGKTNIYVVTPSGAEQVKEFYRDSDIEVINIYLAADKNNRIRRLLARDWDSDKDNTPPIEKTNERIKRDQDIFKTVKADYTIDANRSVGDVLQSIIDILEG